MGCIAQRDIPDVGAFPHPFAWVGVQPDSEDAGRPGHRRPRKPPKPTRSRLTGGKAFLAPYYRALAPMTPAKVRKLRPTEVASILGLDRVEAVLTVPLLDGAFVDTGGSVPAELLVPVGSQAGQQRLRRVVT